VTARKTSKNKPRIGGVSVLLFRIVPVVMAPPSGGPHPRRLRVVGSLKQASCHEIKLQVQQALARNARGLGVGSCKNA